MLHKYIFRGFFYWAILCPSLLFLFFSAWLLFKNDALQTEIRYSSIDKLNENIEYPRFVISPIKEFLLKANNQTNIDSNVLLQGLQLYLDRSPLDADAWLMGSRVYQQAGDFDLALSYLSVAHNLSETNTPVLLKVFNRYLELNLIEKAMPVANDIVLAKPYEFRRLFYLMSRLSSNYGLVVDKVIPKQGPTPNLPRKVPVEIHNIYYEWALLDSMRAKNTLLANEVWNQIPTNEKTRSTIGMKYLNYLSQFQKLDLIEPVWTDVVGAPLIFGELLDNGVDENSPCWKVKPNENVDVSILKGEGGGSLIEVNFLGRSNINYNHLSCMIPVNPEAKYRLSGRNKSKNLSTLSGPYIDVYFPGVKKKINRTEDIIGSSAWINFYMDFDVPENIYFAEIRIRRNATNLLDSKISGAVWFDSLELTSIE